MQWSILGAIFEVGVREILTFAIFSHFLWEKALFLLVIFEVVGFEDFGDVKRDGSGTGVRTRTCDGHVLRASHDAMVHFRLDFRNRRSRNFDFCDFCAFFVGKSTVFVGDF